MAKKIHKGKKRWYDIQAPAVFNNQSLGQTYVWEDEALPGRIVSVNLMTLTGNPKKQSMAVHFAITNVAEGVAKTKTIGIEMQPGSLKRLVRRGRSKVADSFESKTKKGQRVRVKLIAMTRTRADDAVQRAVRSKARTLIAESLSKYSFDTIVNDVANMRLQKHLKDQLSAIFPIRSVDVRALRYTQGDSEEEAEVEETQYTERPKREKVVHAPAEGLQSLKDELDEALAAEKDDSPKPKKASTKPEKEEDEEE